MSTSASTIAPWTTQAAPTADLEASREYCERRTRQEARNFYYGLRLLPEPKRSAMFALYTYMRMVDDIVDEEDGRSHEQRARELEAWRAQTHAVLAGRPGAVDEHALWPAFADMVRGFGVPHYLFDDVIEGQRQDLNPQPFPSFEELSVYCYRVAGVVGLASIYIWGFEGGKATEELAIKRGIAFQLTNILRDLRSDAAAGRMYLPASELAEFGISEQDVRGARGGDGFLRMMRAQIERADMFYEQSSGLERLIERDARPTLVAMTAIYRGLLRKIAVEPERTLRERVSLSTLHKLRIGWRASWAR